MDCPFADTKHHWCFVRLRLDHQRLLVRATGRDRGQMPLREELVAISAPCGDQLRRAARAASVAAGSSRMSGVITTA